MSTMTKLAALAFLAASAGAMNMRRASITNCPNDFLSYISNDQTYCCPGNIVGEGTKENNYDVSNAYCCVGAPFNVATPSFASCFPFCSSTSGGDRGVTVVSDTTSYGCATKIYLTDSDYSSKAVAASTLTSTFNPTATTSAGTTASATSSASSGSGSGSGSGSTTASQTGSASGASASSSASSSGPTGTSSGFAAKITSGPMAGAVMVAGGLLAAAL